MISHGKNVKVFCANANRPFAEGVCRKLWLPLGDCTVTTFADGEVSLTINESVRGSDVFLVQSTCKPVNNNLMELLIMIDACRRASAGRITAVIPYFGYARQDLVAEVFQLCFRLTVRIRRCLCSRLRERDRGLCGRNIQPQRGGG